MPRSDKKHGFRVLSGSMHPTRDPALDLSTPLILTNAQSKCFG